MRKIAYVDMDGVLCDYKSSFDERIVKNSKILYPQCEYGFFKKLKPIENSIFSYFELKKKYEVFILSRPSILNPLSYTEKRVWVENNLGIGECSKLILSVDKTLLRGSYLIDDNVQEGLFKPEWEHIHFGSNKYPNWQSILKKIM